MKYATSPSADSFRADIHTHTTFSDGTLTPSDLIALAVKVGLKGLSITDHDTVEAYQTARAEAAKVGLELLPGVELSSRDERESVHVLGYGFDPDDPIMRDFCEKRVVARLERNAQILKRLCALGMSITQEEIEQLVGIRAKRVFGRPHIAKVMQQKGYVSSMREAFDRWLADGRPGYAPGQDATVQEVIDAIHNAKGKAVLAHPHYLRYSTTVKRLLSMNFDGLECYYSTLSKSSERLWIQHARSKGWIATGGSDFHGDNKPHIPLGCSWVDEATFRMLQGSR